MDYSIPSDFDPWLLKWDEEEDDGTAPKVPVATRPDSVQFDTAQDPTKKTYPDDGTNMNSTRTYTKNEVIVDTQKTVPDMNNQAQVYASSTQTNPLAPGINHSCSSNFIVPQTTAATDLSEHAQNSILQFPKENLKITNPHHQQASVAPSGISQPSTGSTKPEATVEMRKQDQSEQARSSQPNQPFFLFDAPCELRTNFLLSQRIQASPAGHENNTHHYGMAVNGFHPQLNAQFNPLTPISSTDGVFLNGLTFQPGVPLGTDLKLIDGRYKGSRTPGGKQRNEREQKRAQKITELIEHLRLSMVKGGWKVEMKSKYHTLSTCADYVKHLIKSNQEKEAAVEKAKSDLTLREQKLEEDKAMQESRSDPESVTSSLTTSSNESRTKTEHSALGARISTGDTDTHKTLNLSGAAANVISLSSDSRYNDNDAGTPSGNINKEHTTRTDASPHKTVSSRSSRNKKVTLSDIPNKNNGNGEDDGISSTDSSSEEGNCIGGPRGKNISLDKMSSSMSDMTDSNKSSSDGTRRIFGKKTIRLDLGDTRMDEENENSGSEEPISSSSISSTAAVISGVGSREYHDHADVVIKENYIERKRKRKNKEKTSLDTDFALDYEEVFLTSNIPQLIATPAGRIVTCNDFFLRSTGLTVEEVGCLTIFSIVRVDKLSQLFEIVADALEKDSTPSVVTTSKEHAASSQETCNSSGNNEDIDYEALTLPCIQFPSRYKTTKNNSDIPIPIFMTVTLMPDEDPRKRCLHCIFSDNPGTKSSIGAVSPNLLALLLSKDSKNNLSKKEKERPSAIDVKISRTEKMTDISESIKIEHKRNEV